MSRVAQPGAVAQQSNPGCGEKSHFRAKLPRLFHAVIEFARKFFFKKNDELARGGTVLRSAKAKNIHARLPCDFLGRAPKRRHRIRKARAVHVQAEIVLRREFGDRAQLVDPIDRAQLRRLCNADRARLWGMQFGLPRDCSGDLCDFEFAVRAGRRKQFGAAREN